MPKMYLSRKDLVILLSLLNQPDLKYMDTRRLADRLRGNPETVEAKITSGKRLKKKDTIKWFKKYITKDDLSELGAGEMTKTRFMLLVAERILEDVRLDD